jgi:hypothetical protein
MKKRSTAKRDPEVEAFLDYLDAMPSEAIDWETSPRTTAADWADAEVLLPVDRKTFHAIEAFIAKRRERAGIG